MDSNEEAADDQSSGWLQVKKKHRSSSKLTLHGWVGGFSSKGSSSVSRSQPSSNVKYVNSHSHCGSQRKNAREDFAVSGCLDSVGKSTSTVLRDEMNVHYLDKCVVSLDSRYPKSALLAATDVTDSHCKTGDDHRLPQKDNPNTFSNIKWGNLDDGALLVHNRNTTGAEIRFGDISDDNLLGRKAEKANKPVPYISSHSDQRGKTLVATFAGADNFLNEENMSSLNNMSIEENCKDVNEVPCEDVKLQIINGEEVNPGCDDSCCIELLFDLINVMNTEPLNSNILSSEPIPETTGGQIPEPALVCEMDDSMTSDVPINKEASENVVVSQELELLSPTPGEHMTTASTEVSGSQHADKISDEKAQFINAINVDGLGESKERFRQRLWCFLFENLNRAVDELYLLCELECDLEQMKEAILVLEEAASDFKELNSRVEEFEKVKKSCPQLIDGAIATMKSDHRRPHALSWEVRRMTNSPHRAEILSSSLEAFRRIQQERACIIAVADPITLERNCQRNNDTSENNNGKDDALCRAEETVLKARKQSGIPDLINGNSSFEKYADSGNITKINSEQSSCLPQQNQSASDSNALRLQLKESSAASVSVKSRREMLGFSSDMEKLLPRKDKMLSEKVAERSSRSVDLFKKQNSISERDKEKRNTNLWKSMDAWKEKRNWEDILASPFRGSYRFSHSPGMGRKSAERARTLHDKLMSTEKKKKSALDLKKEAEEKHARAMRIRGELENERVQKLQRTSEKLNRVNEWQAVRSMKLREVMYARQQRSESRHEAFLAEVVRRAGDESSKVNEVRFITSLNEENKKLMLRQKLRDSELRRAGKLQMMRSKQKEDMAREEAVLERKKIIEAEKLQRLAETQRKKEEAQVRREEERKASSAAREAKAMEQMRRKEIRARAQQEEAELLAQKLAERLSESEQRRRFYLEQIRERASMDFRDQSSPSLRRFVNKDAQGRLTPTNSNEDCLANNVLVSGGPALPTANAELQQSLKRRIKRIRQRLMALKYEFAEPSVGAENSGIGYRMAMGTARAKIGRWLQELQKLRQARKEGSASIGLITAEMIKFLEGKDPELQASRQAGLLDFIASALPASHTSKPEACQVTIYLLRLLRVVLSVPANRSFFIAQNLLPPVIPMLAAALENYIKIAASSNFPASNSKTSIENLELISEALDGFLWTVTTIIGHASSDERQRQMQDGLVELVIAYQIIHRLRDLFALYDRPQVEGSPFPSSIILSIDLLAVLTSRFRTINSIDWDSFPIETMLGNENKSAKTIENKNLERFPICSFIGDPKSPVSCTALPLPDVPEDGPLDESCVVKRKYDFSSTENNFNKVEFSSSKMHKEDCLHKPSGILVDNTAKYTVYQKDENSVESGLEHKNRNKLGLKQPVAFLLSSISESGLVCLPSLLTAVLLQANNRLSAEQGSYTLPSNFEEVATGVLKVLNNLALIDINFIQKMLAMPDLKTEFFHLMSFLLSHCTNKWGVATDQIGLLLLESLILLGYFALFHAENQAVLRWGKSPTILHKVCDLPFVFFSDPELMPILVGTLVSACFLCEQNKGVVQQELSTDMLLSLIKSCKKTLSSVHSYSSADTLPTDDCCDSNQLGLESRKLHSEIAQRSNRCNVRSSRISSGKSAASGSNIRTAKMRNLKDSKVLKPCEQLALKHNLSTVETSDMLMLHSRFPISFMDKAEQFFSAEVSTV